MMFIVVDFLITHGGHHALQAMRKTFGGDIASANRSAHSLMSIYMPMPESRWE